MPRSPPSLALRIARTYHARPLRRPGTSCVRLCVRPPRVLLVGWAVGAWMDSLNSGMPHFAALPSGVVGGVERSCRACAFGVGENDTRHVFGFLRTEIRNRQMPRRRRRKRASPTPARRARDAAAVRGARRAACVARVGGSTHAQPTPVHRDSTSANGASVDLNGAERGGLDARRGHTTQVVR